MKHAILILFLVTLISAPGCGPSVGDKYHINGIAWLYYDLKDAQAGGPGGRIMDLIGDRKACGISDCGVKVLATGKDWVKVEVLNSTNEGATGWIEAGKLKAR